SSTTTGSCRSSCRWVTACSAPRRRPDVADRPTASWSAWDWLSLPEHGDTAGADGEAAGPVLGVVHADSCARWHHDVLVQDRVADHRALLDDGAVEDDTALHHGPAFDDHPWRQHRLAHDATRDNRAW